MAHVKLDLADLTDQDLAALAQTIITKLTGNASVPTPNPPLIVLSAALSGFTGALGTQGAADAAAKQATAAKDATRAGLEAFLTTEAGTVEVATGGDPAKILSTGMGVQSAPTQITSLDPVTEFSVTMGDAQGALDWHCHRVDRAKAFNVRISAGAMPGAWTMVPGSSRSKGEVTGLTSGSIVWVQVQAVGPHSLTTPWTTAIGCVVP